MSDDPCRLGDLQTRIAVLERAFELRQAGLQMALELQAKEYERRLDALNHEAERIRTMQHSFIAREVYEVQHALMAAEVEGLRRFKDFALGRQSVIAAAVAVFVSVAIAFITHGIWGN